tara:strand:- start:50984 stop:51289 length:306 start_codon:yes stop_codon:yes gene_type:complete
MNTARNVRLANVLLAPHVSEKSSMVADKARQFVFKVAKDANKHDVKAAVEKMFSVEVTNVNISNVKGKTRVFRQKQGKRSDWKKAYVSLKEGHEIDFVGKE